MSTRREEVLKALEQAAEEGVLTVDGRLYRCEGGWTDGWLLCHWSIGGTEGLRRLRELRAKGHTIRMRKIEGRSTRQYRLQAAGTGTPVVRYVRRSVVLGSGE